MRARIPITLGLAIALFACEDHEGSTAPDGPAAAPVPATLKASGNGSTASQIARLRQLVAPFHTFQTAFDAGWLAPITPCLKSGDLPSTPGSGAMGFHWGNVAYIQDGGVVDLLQPELLLYEPEKNGKLRFVGVEYIVPFTDRPATGPAPLRPCWGSSSPRYRSSACGGSTSTSGGTTRAVRSRRGIPR